jgi:hypothetical protein
MQTGFGFHWGANTYWAPNLSDAEFARDYIRQHADDNCLPFPSQVTEFDRDYYENTVLINR